MYVMCTSSYIYLVNSFPLSRPADLGLLISRSMIPLFAPPLIGHAFRAEIKAFILKFPAGSTFVDCLPVARWG